MTPKFGENWLMKCIAVFSFWGLRPQSPRPPEQLGALPLDPAGGTAPDPHYARATALAIAPPPNAKTKLRLCLPLSIWTISPDPVRGEFPGFPLQIPPCVWLRLFCCFAWKWVGEEKGRNRAIHFLQWARAPLSPYIQHTPHNYPTVMVLQRATYRRYTVDGPL